MSFLGEYIEEILYFNHQSKGTSGGGVWCLIPLSTLFQLYHGTFIYKVSSSPTYYTESQLQCTCIFFFKWRICITAINDACLVYDGKLVIDAAFHTNDVSIRGAGTITKFQRKYHADQWTHANFNSKEVGVHVSILILSVQWNLSKQNLLGFNFCIRNRQVFGLYELN